MIQNALNPVFADFGIFTVSHDRRILDRNGSLVVETVGNPALNLFLVQLARVHQLMKRMVDVIQRFFIAQFLFEFFTGPWGGFV